MFNILSIGTWFILMFDGNAYDFLELALIAHVDV
jgi:hypothetical protein